MKQILLIQFVIFFIFSLAHGQCTDEIVIVADDAQLNCGVSETYLIALHSSNSQYPSGYQWSTGNSGFDILVNQAGTYSVTATFPNGCTAESSFTLTEDYTPPVAMITASSTEISCVNTPVALDASGSTGQGSLLYEWNNGQTLSVINIYSQGTYVVTITDDYNLCTSTASITITQGSEESPTAIVTVAESELNCDITSTVIDASSSFGQNDLIFSWSNGAASESITVSSPGTYTVTIVDAIHGCSVIRERTITENMVPPIVDITSTTSELTCGVIDATLTASASGQGALNYLWSTGQITSNITVGNPGIYAVTVIDADNGCSATSEFTLTENTSPPIANITSDYPAFNCAVSSIQLDASSSFGQGTLTYAWSNGSSNAVTTVSTEGIYMVTVVDTDNNCTATGSITLGYDNNSPLNLFASNLVNASCYGSNDGYIELGVNGGAPPYTYNWSTGNVGNAIYGYPAGNYCVTVTDANSCTAEDCFEFTEPNPLNAMYSTSNGNVINGNTSSTTINIAVNGGTGLYTYAWSNGHASSSLLVEEAGVYGVTVTDANNCSAVETITITENFAELYVDHTATGANDGSSWSNAFTHLQDALLVGTGLRIHIAAGTYIPTTDEIRGKAFVLTNGTRILGGYPNGGGVRDYETNETILSGSIDSHPNPEGNSYHVVSVRDVSNVQIDGVTIRDGNADDSNSFGRSRGGGIYIKGSFETLIKNTTIKWNKGIYGGGLFATQSPFTRIENCEFRKNTADNGSAIYHSNETMIYIEQTKIEENTSLNRCAIEANNSNSTHIENSVIANNSSPKANAISVIATNRNGSLTVNNSTILGGSLERSLLTFQIGFGDQLYVSMYNTIVAHQQTSFTKVVKVYNNGILNMNTDHCYFQGSNVVGNTNNNLYSTLDGSLVLNADYSLSPCSPGVDDGTTYSGISSVDIDDNPRQQGSSVDMGAYEAGSSCKQIGTENKLSENRESFMYPNPTQGEIMMNGNLEQPTLLLYDATGRQLFSVPNFRMNISDLPSGIYYVKIMDGGEYISTEKIIKK